ncbi:hypothetical protein NL108_002587, partial [Boleophthalmus pectinirostris]
RGEGVVAHILTSRLLRVTHKLALFIIVDCLSAHRRKHDAKNYEHREPDLPHKRRVVGDLIQQPRQEAPTHDAQVPGELVLWKT